MTLQKLKIENRSLMIISGFLLCFVPIIRADEGSRSQGMNCHNSAN